MSDEKTQPMKALEETCMQEDEPFGNIGLKVLGLISIGALSLALIGYDNGMVKDPIQNGISQCDSVKTTYSMDFKTYEN